MGETFCLQPLASFSGQKKAAPTSGLSANTDLNQPVLGWCDAKDFKDATFHVQILRLADTDGTNKVRLVIQTATSAAGPWTQLADYDEARIPVGYHESFAASTGGTASKQLERFVRWSVDTSTLAGTTTWTMCFGICVTLK